MLYEKIGINKLSKDLKNKKKLRQPGVEPGSAAWKATMITATPLTLLMLSKI